MLMRVIIATICPIPLEIPPRVILASKLSLIIFIGLCGPVELLLVHSNVTHLVGLSVDCNVKSKRVSYVFSIGALK